MIRLMGLIGMRIAPLGYVFFRLTSGMGPKQRDIEKGMRIVLDGNNKALVTGCVLGAIARGHRHH